MGEGNSGSTFSWTGSSYMDMAAATRASKSSSTTELSCLGAATSSTAVLGACTSTGAAAEVSIPVCLKVVSVSTVAGAGSKLTASITKPGSTKGGISPGLVDVTGLDSTTCFGSDSNSIAGEAELGSGSRYTGIG